MKEHILIVAYLLLAYFVTNAVVAMKMRVFTLGRRRKREHALYIVAFLLEGSIIMLGIGLMELVRRLDNESDQQEAVAKAKQSVATNN